MTPEDLRPTRRVSPEQTRHLELTTRMKFACEDVYQEY